MNKCNLIEFRIRKNFVSDTIVRPQCVTSTESHSNLISLCHNRATLSALLVFVGETKLGTGIHRWPVKRLQDSPHKGPIMLSSCFLFFLAWTSCRTRLMDKQLSDQLNYRRLETTWRPDYVTTTYLPASGLRRSLSRTESLTASLCRGCSWGLSGRGGGWSDWRSLHSPRRWRGCWYDSTPRRLQPLSLSPWSGSTDIHGGQGVNDLRIHI